MFERGRTQTDQGKKICRTSGARRGDTSLHWAALKGHEAVIQRLLAAGAAVEAANNEGRGLGKGIFRGG